MTDTGVLRVHLSHALNLRSRDANGASDPYVKLQLGKNKATQKRSKTIMKTLQPRWDEDFDFRGSYSQIVNEVLHVEVWDYDRFTRNDTMGTGVLHLNDPRLNLGVEGGKPSEVVVELKDQQAKPGEVHLFISWESDVVGGSNGIPTDIVNTFNYFDANRSGFIDYAELREALRHYGVEASIVQTAELVRRYDDNPDGKLELAEFAELIRDLETHVVRSAPRSPYGGRGLSGARGSAPARASAIFDEYDVNRSGFLDYKELRGALTRYGINLSSAASAEMVRRYDSNPDGKLDLHEFEQLIRDLEGQGYHAQGAAPSHPPPRGALHSPGGYNPPKSYRSSGSYASNRTTTSPYGSGRGYGGPSSLTSPAYGGAAGKERYMAPPPFSSVSAYGPNGEPQFPTPLEALRYLLDVIFRTLCYALATAAIVAPTQLVGDADWLAHKVGKDSAKQFVDDMPTYVWMTMATLLLVLLFVWSNCCGLRRPCLNCCEGMSHCWQAFTRCCRAFAACCVPYTCCMPYAYSRYDDLEGGYGGGYGGSSYSSSWRSSRYGGR